MKKVLMIAYHYPPVRVSSGVQRTLKFSSYLRDHGWEPILLTVRPAAYDNVSDDQLKEIPEGMVLQRSWALNATRDLAYRKRYFSWTALPDQWSTWALSGYRDGLRLIREHQPDVLWSTYPIATAHLIALMLHKKTRLPWVADCRDPMVSGGFPQGRMRKKIYHSIEKRVVRNSDRCVVTTPGTRDLLSKRYPDATADKWVVIANGYDEENFVNAEKDLPPPPPKDTIRLVHSGVLYPRERDPRSFFKAVKAVMGKDRMKGHRLEVILRATGNDEYFARMITEHGLEHVVKIAPSIPYKAALQEMMQSHGLLIFQDSSCNQQIPAKVYEYIRAGKPILAMTDSAGDTAGVLRQVGVDAIAPIDDAAAIEQALEAFLPQLENDGPSYDPAVVESYSRKGGTAILARLLDTVHAERHG